MSEALRWLRFRDDTPQDRAIRAVKRLVQVLQNSVGVLSIFGTPVFFLACVSVLTKSDAQQRTRSCLPKPTHGQ